MANKPKKDSIRDKAVDQIMTAWDECEKQFYAAIKANDKQRGQVVFAVTIDKMDEPPAVSTRISFKDVETEGGLKVNKTFSKVIGGKVDDEDQGTLPLDNDGVRPSKRLFDADEPSKKKPAAAPKKKAASKPKAKSESKKKKTPKEPVVTSSTQPEGTETATA